MKVPQPEGTRGSLKWIQRLVGSHQQVLDDAIRGVGVLQPGEQIRWVSPRAEDGWAEYRDGDFMDQIGHPELRSALGAFWPPLGPQWDALGSGTAGTVVLVEAKAHERELVSICQASPESVELITRSLAETKAAVGARGDADWLTGYYQYANRIAHLQFLRKHGVPAVLVFVYFTNDLDMGGPNSREGWQGGLRAAHEHLGLTADENSMGVVSVYIDTGLLG